MNRNRQCSAVVVSSWGDRQTDRLTERGRQKEGHADRIRTGRDVQKERGPGMQLSDVRLGVTQCHLAVPMIASEHSASIHHFFCSFPDHQKLALYPGMAFYC